MVENLISRLKLRSEGYSNADLLELSKELGLDYDARNSAEDFFFINNEFHLIGGKGSGKTLKIIRDLSSSIPLILSTLKREKKRLVFLQYKLNNRIHFFDTTKIEFLRGHYRENLENISRIIIPEKIQGVRREYYENELSNSCEEYDKSNEFYFDHWFKEDRPSEANIEDLEDALMHKDTLLIFDDLHYIIDDAFNNRANVKEIIAILNLINRTDCKKIFISEDAISPKAENIMALEKIYPDLVNALPKIHNNYTSVMPVVPVSIIIDGYDKSQFYTEKLRNVPKSVIVNKTKALLESLGYPTRTYIRLAREMRRCELNFDIEGILRFGQSIIAEGVFGRGIRVELEYMLESELSEILSSIQEENYYYLNGIKRIKQLMDKSLYPFKIRWPENYNERLKGAIRYGEVNPKIVYVSQKKA